MENSKLIFVVVLILTFLVGGSLGFLIGEKTSSAPQRHLHYQRQVQPKDELKARTARHLAKDALKRKLQEKQRESKKADVLLKVLSKKCDLTSKQEEEIRDILESKRDQMQDIRKDVKDKMEQIKEETDVEIEGVLTQEQKEQFEELKGEAAKKQRLKGRF